MNQKILIVATEFPPGPGGIGSHAWSMAKAFACQGLDVLVLAPADYASSEQVEAFDRLQNFKIIRFERKSKWSYVRRFSLVQAHLRQQVILSGKFALWIGLWLKIFHPKVQTIGVLHGSEINLSNALLRIITHWAIFSLHDIVAVSRFTKNLIPEWIRKRKKITIIPNGIDTERLNAMPHTIPLKGSPVLLTVGNVTPRKGQHRMIRAMPEVLKQLPEAHYHIVGLPTFKDQFSELARTLNVQEHVTFHGRVEKFETLFDYYSSSDIFVILSENQSDGDVEGFGIVVLEAGYFSLPTLGAKGCGVEDAVENGRNGYLVDGNNSQDIYENIASILHNKDNMRSNARQWALKHDWNIIIKDFIKILNP